MGEAAASVGSGANGLTPLKIAVVGGNAAVHQFVCALVALRSISPALFGLVEPQVLVVPAGCNDLAAYMCRVDGWYLRHLAAPWAAPLCVVPRLDEARGSEAVSKAGDTAEDQHLPKSTPAAAAPQSKQPDGDAVLSAKLCDLLQSYARGAHVPMPVCLYQCECWAHDGGGEPDVTIPFAMSVEVGLMAEAASVQRKRDRETLEETLASKSFQQLAANVPLSALRGGGPLEEDHIAVSGATPPLRLSYAACGEAALKRTVLAPSPYAAVTIRAVPADPSSVSYGARARRSGGERRGGTKGCSRSAEAAEEIDAAQPRLQLQPHALRPTQKGGAVSSMLGETMRKHHRKPKDVEVLLRQFTGAEGCDAAGTVAPLSKAMSDSSTPESGVVMFSACCIARLVRPIFQPIRVTPDAIFCATTASCTA